MKGLVFTYLLCYGGAFVSLFNPFVGLLVYVAFAILKPEALWYWESHNMPANSSRIVAIALLAGWILRGTGNWELGKAWKIVYALLGFLGWGVVSTLQSSYPDVGWTFVEEMCKIVLPFLVGITTIDSVKKLRLLAWVIILSHGYVSVELNLTYYLERFNRLAEVGVAGVDNNCFCIALDTAIGLAAFMALSTPRWWLKLLSVILAGSMAHAVLLSFSRGGMLGLLMVGLASFLLLKKNSWHYLMFAVAALMLLRLAGTQVQERFLSSFEGGSDLTKVGTGRAKLWLDCIDVMIHHPIFGIGPGQFGFVAPQYGWELGKLGHTLWLQVGAEMGVVGLLLLVLFYTFTGWPLWRMIRASEPAVDPELQDLARMVIASLVGFAVSAQFVSLVGLEVPYYVALIGAGTLKVAGRAAEERDYEDVPGGALAMHGLGTGQGPPYPRW